MAVQHLSVQPLEQSVLAITIPFADEAGVVVTPSSAQWTLTDDRGVVVNSRSRQAISPLDDSVVVVLTGDDLAYDVDAYNGVRRHFLVEYVYSSTLGSDLPGKELATFDIQPLAAVS